MSHLKYLFLLLSLSFVACAVVPAQKANRVNCPVDIPTDEADRPLDGMAISEGKAVLVCGHREDLKLAKRMRVSDFSVVIMDVGNGEYSKLATFSAFDQRYVQLFPAKKELEVISVVLRNDEKPIPILRDLYNCSTASCVLKKSSCVYKSESARDLAPVAKIKDLKKWWLVENQDARLQQVYLSSLAGHPPSRILFDQLRARKIPLTGTIAELAQVYSIEEFRARTLCKNHEAIL